MCESTGRWLRFSLYNGSCPVGREIKEGKLPGGAGNQRRKTARWGGKSKKESYPAGREIKEG